MTFTYLLKNLRYIPFIRYKEWGSWHVSNYYLIENFKFATSFKDQRIETCHMAMLNNL
jgi:hypothetical protein